MLTRDSLLWKVLFYGGLVLAVALEVFNALTPEMAADLGISARVLAWLRVAYVISVGLGGKLGLSPLAKKGDGDPPIRPGRFATLLVLALVASIASVGCAGTLRDRVRTSALMASETVLTLNQMEYDLYAMGAYGAEPAAAKKQHLAIGAKVDNTILAVRAYERGARAWPAELPTMPANLPELQRLALDALAQLARVLDGVRGAASMQGEITKLLKQIGG